MPSSVTHNFFSVDVYNRLSNKIKRNIKNSFNEYKVFAQGPDPYFFYDFHLTRRSKKVYEINKAMQHTLINTHFITLINYINDKIYYSNSMVMAYLYGQICHFALDTICHPFVFYYTGIYNKEYESTYKYNGLHEEMEYFIDCYLIWKKKNILPKKYKMYKELFCKMNFNNELRDAIDNVTHDVYGFSDVSNKYLKSINDMKKFYHVFNYDRFGIKKIIYSMMDIVCPKSIVKKKELSFNIDPNSKLYYLNNDKEEWCSPWDNKEVFNYSFLDLYDIAIKRAINIITVVDDMLKNKKVDNYVLEKLFGNFDYGTGKDCNLDLKFYFYKF